MIRRALLSLLLALSLTGASDASVLGSRGAASARGFGFGAANAVVPFDTFDLSVSAPNVALSNGNLTATKTTNNAFNPVQTLSTTHTTGKYYAEMVFTFATAGNVGGGVERLGWNTATGSYPGHIASSVGVRANGFGENDGVTWVSAAADLTWTTGIHLFIAVDVGSGLVWLKKEGGTNWNNSGTANPATGVGGVALSGSGAVRLGATVFANGSELVTVNTGQTAFTGTVPSGFSAWH